jgi:hypothetical protein
MHHALRVQDMRAGHPLEDRDAVADLGQGEGHGLADGGGRDAAVDDGLQQIAARHAAHGFGGRRGEVGHGVTVGSVAAPRKRAADRRVGVTVTAPRT